MFHRYLTHETAVKLANALVSSLLDYCKITTLSHRKTYIMRLQRVLYCTVCNQNKFSHVTHPTQAALDSYSGLYTVQIQPSYLQGNEFSKIPYLSSLIMQSDITQGHHLSVSSTRPNKCIEMCSLAVAAHTEWNKLHQVIRTVESITGFQKQLKTYLFRLAYPPP